MYRCEWKEKFKKKTFNLWYWVNKMECMSAFHEKLVIADRSHWTTLTYTVYFDGTREEKKTWGKLSFHVGSIYFRAKKKLSSLKINFELVNVIGSTETNVRVGGEPNWTGIHLFVEVYVACNAILSTNFTCILFMQSWDDNNKIVQALHMEIVLGYTRKN